MQVWTIRPVREVQLGEKKFVFMLDSDRSRALLTVQLMETARYCPTFSLCGRLEALEKPTLIRKSFHNGYI